MTPPLVRVAAAATLTLFLAACGGSSGGSTANTAATTSGAASAATSSAPAAAAGQITISSFQFTTPPTVKPGQKVSVQNKDSVDHTVTADDGKSFNATAAADATTSFTAPSKPGTYKFHCTIHPQMHGVLVVKA